MKKIDYSIFALMFHIKCTDEELIVAHVLKKNTELKKQGRFQKAGCYERYLIPETSDIHHNKSCGICVPRARGVHRAFLSDILIPHSSYSLRFVLMTIWLYLLRSGSVADLCELRGIGLSTIYDWLHRFGLHQALWKDQLRAASDLSDEIISGRLSHGAFTDTFQFCFGEPIHRNTSTLTNLFASSKQPP